MLEYTPTEARSWAFERLVGCCGCILPTFTSDVSDLNEAAIRHDVDMERAIGMAAVLVVAECGTTMDEYRRLLEIVVDAAGSDLMVVVQASQPTWDQMQTTIEWGAELGADLVLPSYPLTYHPTTLEELYEDNKRMIDRSPLGVLLFAIDQWNFSRLHPAAFPLELLERLVDDCPMLVGIKNEIGLPYVGGMDEVFSKLGDRVVVTDPMESNAPIWVKHYGMRYMGTSNYEAFGARIPQMLKALGSDDTWDEGMRLYWQNHPIRKANSAVVSPTVAATGMVPRAVWKYQSWLLGFNGGPLRAPLARINAGQMAMIRKAATDAGLDVTDDPDELFWTGRNPA
jgi:dihydrodipicolinate synthase/N-acetylneuraminate lyase